MPEPKSGEVYNNNKKGPSPFIQRYDPSHCTSSSGGRCDEHGPEAASCKIMYNPFQDSLAAHGDRISKASNSDPRKNNHASVQASNRVNYVDSCNSAYGLQVPHSTRTQALPNISSPDGGDRRKKAECASLPSKRIRLFHDNSSCAAMGPGMSVTAPDWKPSAPSAPEACQVAPMLDTRIAQSRADYTAASEAHLNKVTEGESVAWQGTPLDIIQEVMHVSDPREIVRLASTCKSLCGHFRGIVKASALLEEFNRTVCPMFRWSIVQRGPQEYAFRLDDRAPC
ncbi:hypothetical protein WJX75_005902 [Coccomyxa subellipsoidea]|uniref:F-box domain-containing protein n=1 Tax=Coccomyxa subellipsoidea TaxID=248742 RepID=A0ABR2Z3J5_9CHLO